MTGRRELRQWGEHLDRLSCMLDFVPVVTGCELQLNPFEQPHLQQSTDDVTGALRRSAVAGGDVENRDLRSLIDGLEPPADLAIIGHRPYSDAVGAPVGRLRTPIRSPSGAATTFGYSPRHPHLADQLNTGSPAPGLSLRLGRERDRDLEIRGRGYSFRRVIDTRAPDLSVLGARGLTVARVPLSGDDPAGAIDELVAPLGKGSG